MKGGQFRKLAEDSLRHYGDDPWFFLRELAQNSRDAGASNIWVEARWSSEKETLLFEDDGSGMSFQAAKAYLYRLYASSKEGDDTTAGMFGVGFWSVLRYRPSSIRVESCSRKECWAVGLDQNLEPRRESSQLAHQGTCVVLERATETASEEELVAALREGLARTCGHLRMKRGRGRVLPVWFRERQVSGPLKLDCEMQMPFRQGRVDGVVGLGPEPSVELFVRGLPVWKGNLLEELSSKEHRTGWRSDLAQGLAPVVKVNADHLTVVLSRTAVVDDSALAEVREVTHRAVERLVGLYLNQSLGRSWWRTGLKNLGLGIRRRALPLGVVVGLGLLALLLLRQEAQYQADVGSRELADDQGLSQSPDAGEADPARRAAGSGESESSGSSGLLHAVEDGTKGDIGGAEDATAGADAAPDEAAAAGDSTVDFTGLQARMRYLGSQVEGAERSPAPLLTWKPEKDLYWRILQSQRFEPTRGFVAEVTPSAESLPVTPATCSGQGLDVSLTLLRASGPAILPVASGYALASGTALVAGVPKPVLLQSDGTAVVEAGQGRADVAYTLRACAESGTSLHELEGRPDTAAWPAELAQAVDAACISGPESVRQSLAQRFTYDASTQLAAQFAARTAESAWLPFVWSLKRGDCDVLNGLAVLALDRCGYEAHLAMGFVGIGGRLLPGLHAWAEYRSRSADGQVDAPWQVMDLTQRATVVASGGGPAQPVVPPSVLDYRPWRRMEAGEPPMAANGAPVDMAPSLPLQADVAATVKVEGGTLPQAVAVSPAAESAGVRQGSGSAGVRQGSGSGSGSVGDRPGERIVAADGRGGDRAGEETVVEGMPLSLRYLVALGAASAALLLLLGLVLLTLGRRFRGRAQRAVSRAEADEVVAKLALGALVQPHVWGARSELFKRPVLLTHGGVRLSLGRSIRLASSGGLFVAKADNSVAAEVVAGRNRILMATEGPMADVVRRIPRALDLEQLDALSLVAGVGVAEEAMAASEWLSTVWCKALGSNALRLVVFASPAQEEVVRDFDLGPLRFRKGSSWRRRVIAVNLVRWGARHRPVNVASARRATKFSPERVYDLAQHITTHSLLLASRGALLRETAAAALLEAGWGERP